MIHVWTTAPGILQLALDEEGGGAPLASFDSWASMLDVLFDENETCGLTANDQLLSAATYASSALLHNDLDYEPVCVYLDDETGTVAPTASSTMWVLEVNPELDETHRRMLQDQLRDVFTDRSTSSTLTYQVISNCLLYTSPSPRDLSTSRMPSSA